MPNKKQTTILALSIVFLAILGLSSFYIYQIYQKNQRQIQQAKEQKQEEEKKLTKIEKEKEKQEQEQEKQKQEELKNNPEYGAQLIKEEGGWKRYLNPYWGIEFRFKDEEDKMVVRMGSKSDFFITDNEMHDIYVYISIYQQDDFNDSTLKSYLQKNQNWSSFFPDAPELKLISMKDFTNKNQVEYIKVKASARSIKKNKTVVIEEYFLNYNNPKHKDKNFIVIHGGGTIQDQIVSSFKFIDN